MSRARSTCSSSSAARPPSSPSSARASAGAAQLDRAAVTAALQSLSDDVHRREPALPADRAYAGASRDFLALLGFELAREADRLPLSADALSEGDPFRLPDPQPGSGLGALRAIGQGLGAEDLSDHAAECVRAGVRAILDCTPSPHAALTKAYESILSLRAVQDGNGICLRSGRARSQSGSFFTPDGPASQVTAATFAVTVSGPRHGDAWMRILDPAMGTGAFLCAAVRHVSTTWGYDAAAVAERCAFGVDIDTLAVQLAVVSLWLETGARPSVLARQMRVGNFLTENPAVGTFDVVLSNPPWGLPSTPEQRRELARRWPLSTRLSFDSFKLFLDLGSARTRTAMGMILPQAVLAQPLHADVREILLARLDPYAVLDLGNECFPGAAAPACALVWGRKPGPRAIQYTGVRRPPGAGCTTQIVRDQWSAGRGFLLASSPIVRLAERLQRRHPLLGSLNGLYRVRDGGINYNRAAVATRVLYAGSQPEDPRDMPRYRGRNFGPYTSIGTGGWMRHDAMDRLLPGEVLSIQRTLYERAEKIAIRQTADRLVATMDRTGMAMGRSVLAVTAEGDAPLLPVLACLNSCLLTQLYQALSGESGRLLPQVKVARLVQLPLPSACLLQPWERDVDLDGNDASLLRRSEADGSFAWDLLGRLAARLLASEGRDARALSLAERLMCVLYGLSDRERRLLTGNTTAR